MLIGTKTIFAFFALLALAGGQLRGEIAPSQTGTSLAVVGDSYAAGVGARSTHAWQHYAALDLGWSLDAVRAFPGAGYLNPGVRQPFDIELLLDPLPVSTRQVIVQGGFNDLAYDAEQVGAAVTRTLALIHEQAPKASVTVVGVFDPGPGNYADQFPNMAAHAAAIQQATEAAGDRFVDGLGFRYEVGRDRSHPTPTGHAELGHAIAEEIRSTVTSTVGPWTGRLTSHGSAVIGVSRVEASGVRYFYLASTDGGQPGPVTAVAFGAADDVPLLLTTATGECAPAVYRPATGTLHAASSVVDGGGDVDVLSVGDPVVQNGVTHVPTGLAVVTRGAEQSQFVAHVPGPDGTIDTATLSFGQPGDHGFLFAAAGSGATLGVYRPDLGIFYLADPREPAMRPVTVVPFGVPGDQGLVGAWGSSNVEGSDKVGVFRPSTAQWFLSDTLVPLPGRPAVSTGAVTSFSFGQPGDTALACDPA